MSTTTSPPILSERARALRVLIVEDAEFVHHLYRVAFRRLGLTNVLHAYDGASGLETLEREGPVDLVIADINMPVMDGVEFLNRVRSHPGWERIHVVVASTEENSGKVAELIAAGATSYFQKPFTLEQIVDVLTKVAESLAQGEKGGRA
ncbi:MAG: response regulator [Myxococcaceae bacterium]|nr:response regulator [Myxococcaceae bacterium]